MTTPTTNPEPNTAPPPVIGGIHSVWTPNDEKIRTHTGAPIPDDMAFVGAPPTEEIGDVLTAYSSVRKGKGGDPKYLRRFSWGFLCAWLGIIAVLGTGQGLHLWQPSLLLGVIGAAGGFALGWLFSAPENSTTYVGTRGAAKFVWKGKNAPVMAPKILHYADVSGVAVAQTNNFTNGIYTGTDYAFTFGGQATGTGKMATLFTVQGRYYRANGPAPDNEEYHFGTAIESAYSQFRFPQCVHVLAQGGSVPFSVGGQGSLSVSAQGLRLRLGSKEEFIPKENIADVGINAGMVTIKRAGFKAGVLGIGSDGVYSFSYSQLSSARLFLALLGYTIREATANAAPQ